MSRISDREQAERDAKIRRNTACDILQQFWVFFHAPLLNQQAFADWVQEKPWRDVVTRSLTAKLFQVMGEVRYQQLFSKSACPGAGGELLALLREIFTFDPSMPESYTPFNSGRSRGGVGKYVHSKRHFKKIPYYNFIDFICQIGQKETATRALMESYVYRTRHAEFNRALDDDIVNVAFQEIEACLSFEPVVQVTVEQPQDQNDHGRLLVACMLKVRARKVERRYHEALCSFRASMLKAKIENIIVSNIDQDDRSSAYSYCTAEITGFMMQKNLLECSRGLIERLEIPTPGIESGEEQDYIERKLADITIKAEQLHEMSECIAAKTNEIRDLYSQAKHFIHLPELDSIQKIAGLHRTMLNKQLERSEVFEEALALIEQLSIQVQPALEFLTAIGEENSTTYQQLNIVNDLFVDAPSIDSGGYFQEIYNIKLSQWIDNEVESITTSALSEIESKLDELDVVLQPGASYQYDDMNEFDCQDVQRLVFVVIFPRLKSCVATIHEQFGVLADVQQRFLDNTIHLQMKVDQVSEGDNCHELWIGIFTENIKKLEKRFTDRETRLKEKLSDQETMFLDLFEQLDALLESRPIRMFVEEVERAEMSARNILASSKDATRKLFEREADSMQNVLSNDDLSYSNLTQLITAHNNIIAYLHNFARFDVVQDEIKKYSRIFIAAEAVIKRVYPESLKLWQFRNAANILEQQHDALSEECSVTSLRCNEAAQNIINHIDSQTKMNTLFSMLRILFYKLDNDTDFLGTSLNPKLIEVEHVFTDFSCEQESLNQFLRACPQYKTLMLTPIRKQNLNLLCLGLSCPRLTTFIESIEVCGQDAPQVKVINAITELELLAEQMPQPNVNSNAMRTEIKKTARALYLDVVTHFSKQRDERIKHYREEIHPLKNKTLNEAFQNPQLSMVPTYKTVLVNIGAAFASLIVFYPVVLAHTRATRGCWFFQPRSNAQERLKSVKSLLETHGDEQHGLVVRPVVAR